MFNYGKVLYSSNPGFGTLAVSLDRQPQYVSLLNPQRTVSPSMIPLQRLVGQHETNALQPSTVPPQNAVYLGYPSSEMHDLFLHFYEGSSCPNDAEQFHLHVIKHGYIGDLFFNNTLINIYIKIPKVHSARKLFDEMLHRNSVTWACLISGYTQNCMPDEACALFKEMIHLGCMPNLYALGSSLRACIISGPYRLELGKQIHGLILKTQFSSDAVVCNVLISMYGSCSDTAFLARSVFEEIGTKSSISWNSIISVYSQRGDSLSTFSLFSCMQHGGSGLGFKPTEYTFGSLLAVIACSSVDLGWHLLGQMLSRIKKAGFLQDLYVGSALVNGFARLGFISDAMKIFERMNKRNAVSVNGLMVGLVKQKQGEDAVKVFREMKHLVKNNFDSYLVLLTACAEFSVLEEGRRKGKELHAHAIRTGMFDAKISMQNGLVNMYSKCGAIEDACFVFSLIVNKDSISWNSIIAGLDKNKRFEGAAMNFTNMRRTGLLPSNFTLISALSSCASLGWVMLGSEIHSEACKLGLDWDVSVSNSLISMYGQTGFPTECEKVFSLMPSYDQVSWNSVIGALTKLEASSFLKSVTYFIKMMRAGWDLNIVTFMNILSIVSSISVCQLGHQIHALVLKYSLANDTAIENALLSFYGRCGEMEMCEKLFGRMQDRRDEVSWNTMISGYIHNEFLPKAMDMARFMMQKGETLDGFTFATVLSACASVATLEHGMEVHACAIRACLDLDVVVGSALVDMYSKCGRIDYAARLFEFMPVKNVYSWNTMISGYARHGDGKKALNLFERMKQISLSLDQVTFVGVLSACSHMGLVEEGWKHFESMKDLYGLDPGMEHYSCMVDLLARAGQLDKVEDFINKMPVNPNVLIWRTVLGACCRVNGRKTELGKRAAKMLLELEPQNAVNYVLLSNMYASGEKWEGVAEARAAMKEAAVKKEVGCSWVTMKDGLHVFKAGDKSHPEKDSIYEKLYELYEKMKDAGYSPQTKFALYDLELENKEELLTHHSEKLAVAFVLARSKDSRLPIRIMKNLRVCGDCHSAFGYISKIVGRQIVLRDSNRFHHFVDGECSCGNYW